MMMDVFFNIIQFVSTTSNINFAEQGTSYQISHYDDNLENINKKIVITIATIQNSDLIQNTQVNQLDHLFMCTLEIKHQEVADYFIKCYICYSNLLDMNLTEDRQTFKKMRNCLKEIISFTKNILLQNFELSELLKILEYFVFRFDPFWQYISERISKLENYFDHFSQVNFEIRNFLWSRSHIIDQYLVCYSLNKTDLSALDINEFPLENINQKLEWLCDNVFVAKLSLNNQINAIRLEIDLVKHTQQLLLLLIQRCKKKYNIDESKSESSLLENMLQNVCHKENQGKVKELLEDLQRIDKISDTEIRITQKVIIKMRRRFNLY
ncbi:hypothetical protein M153_100017426 [Pseudoloma neurophilia]|uniref:Uncharacterized protein n=1 Tax=Pseudoloma neurophilia TaxID=146866 RepID=A0A0R0M120_9MICR|nr:hypothetical protein M153_100017426 [Pseudoloma neurophilia]